MVILKNVHNKRDVVPHGESYLIVGLTSCWCVNEPVYNLIKKLPSSGSRSKYIEALKSLHYDNPDEIINSLHTKGLLQEVPSLLTKVYRFLRAPKIQIIKGSWLSHIAHPKLLKPIFSPLPIYITYMVLMSLLVCRGFAVNELGSNAIATGWQWFVFVGVLLGLAFHEIGHSLACSYAGIGCRPVGLAWYLLWPVAFTNVSGASLLTKKQRLLIDVSGMYFQAWVMVLLFVVDLVWPNYGARFALNFLSYLVLFNLNPFIGSDGYWFFHDIQPEISNQTRKVVGFIYSLGYTIFTVYLFYRVGSHMFAGVSSLFSLYGMGKSLSVFGVIQVMLLFYIQILILIGIYRRITRILNRPRSLCEL